LHLNAFITRHNNIVNVCADATRSVGLTPELESQASKAPTITGNNNQPLSKMRFDLTVAGIADTNIIQADITVASHRQNQEAISKQCARFALYAANNAVTTKQAKYNGALCDNESLFPLAAETSGAIHNNFNQFFSCLATRVDNKPPPQANWTTPTFTSFWMTATSVVLRRENARAIQRLARAALKAEGLAGEDLPDLVTGRRRR
jgi:hypothetical protein